MKPFVPGKPHWWQWPTILSLDAPAVALLWQWQLARVAGLSQFHLARQFRDAFGQSPGAYHRQIRLQVAQEFIDEGLTLDAAAERTGYSDGSALGHALRRARMA